jgi:N-acetylglutamate synthase-like GNAT family acetyltransferase
MQFKLITPDAPEYPAERLLRWEVLSKPYGMPPGSEAFPEEMQSMHLVVIDKKRLVGCILFHPESVKSGRIFEMAVSEEYQGHGFSRKLLHTLEEMLVERGISDVYLYVRQEFEEFYSLMGYAPQEEAIVELGLKQRLMKKNLHVESGKKEDVSPK